MRRTDGGFFALIGDVPHKGAPQKDAGLYNGVLCLFIGKRKDKPFILLMITIDSMCLIFEASCCILNIQEASFVVKIYKNNKLA